MTASIAAYQKALTEGRQQRLVLWQNLVAAHGKLQQIVTDAKVLRAGLHEDSWDAEDAWDALFAQLDEVLELTHPETGR